MPTVRSRNPDYQPREYLQELRRVTEELGIPLLFDEMVTGFRSHPGGAQALFGVKADIATYGKVAGGGLPIGIVAGSPLYMDTLDGGAWSFGDDVKNFTNGMPTRVACSAIASMACFFVPTKRTEPPRSARLRENAAASSRRSRVC